MHSDKSPLRYHVFSFIIAITFTTGITYLLRDHSWKTKIWVTIVIFVTWLLAHIFAAFLPW